MSASTVIVAINDRLLRLRESPNAKESRQGAPAEPESREEEKEKPVTKKEPQA
jgi:hypothetical protein